MEFWLMICMVKNLGGRVWEPKICFEMHQKNKINR